MPAVTRSASGATTRTAAKTRKAATTSSSDSAKAVKVKSTKRKVAPSTEKTSRKKTKSKEASEDEPSPPKQPKAVVKLVALPLSNAAEDAPTLVPAVLTFSFEEAKQHLIGVDGRFEDVFKRLKCRPFEHLESVDPFRTLVNSIMQVAVVGQQISWKAARSITHKFIRLFDPSIPEDPTDHSGPTSFFPCARQVADMDITTLRSAGLSGRKAEYVLDLASRFADGRLSTEKLLAADDEDLYEMLTAVRGIGRWTVDMFAMFSLRRPDILPVGDLGVQRGVLRWFLSLHAPTAYPLTISPEKLPKNPEEEAKTKKSQVDGDVLPVPREDAAGSQSQTRALTPDLSSMLPAPSALPETPVEKGATKGKSQARPNDEDSGNPLPTPFTPSINNILNKAATAADFAPPPLPEGLTAGVLRSRLQGKKMKGVLLTPKEMEELTDGWRPYRSLGVFYMWALAESPK
ncbi:DNA glycosylase [Fomitopsis serialis]|uniref:DNA glycosylase n=1 Tax=Fomitopsis serialis TaxID=139415 RepID=UPI00200819CA|nr:DNA glycosylase [Neoantrodia serialis]KAH9935612.1 DNA glycosylase [Neoantrodia serialis]